MTTTESTPTLRDRKKAATRAALAAAAARRALESGLASVTAEAVAAEAGVSTRTFHNYFASKEDAVLAHVDVAVGVWIDRLVERPAGESVWTSLEECSIGLILDRDRPIDEIAAIVALVGQSPELRMHQLDVPDESFRRLGDAIADRIGADRDSDEPRYIQNVVLGLLNAALDPHCTGELDADAEVTAARVRAAFAWLRSLRIG